MVILQKECVMHRSILTLLLLLIASPLPAAEWKLVWCDEFDRPGQPDPTKWGYEVGFVRNNESQYYTLDRRENARVENGMLIIEAKKERFKPSAGDSRDKGKRSKDREYAEYTSASLTTLNKASWTYGRIEVRAKLSVALGATSPENTRNPWAKPTRNASAARRTAPAGQEQVRGWNPPPTAAATTQL